MHSSQLGIARAVLENMIWHQFLCEPFTVSVQVWLWKPCFVDSSRATSSVLHCKCGPGNHDLLACPLQVLHLSVAITVQWMIFCWNQSCNLFVFYMITIVLEAKIDQWFAGGSCSTLALFYCSLDLAMTIYCQPLCYAFTLAWHRCCRKLWFAIASRRFSSCLHPKYGHRNHDPMTRLVPSSHPCTTRMDLEIMITGQLPCTYFVYCVPGMVLGVQICCHLSFDSSMFGC